MGFLLNVLSVFPCSTLNLLLSSCSFLKIIDVFPLNTQLTSKSNEELEKALRKKLRERYEVDVKVRLPILRKLQEFAKHSKLILIIRDKQLTRGGEYIEFAFLLLEEVDPSKIVFLWNRNVELSSMVKELLDAFYFNFRAYGSEDELLDEVHRLIYYRVIENVKR